MARIPKPILVELGKRVRKARTAAGLTQEALSHETDFARSYIADLEMGRRNIAFTNLCRLASALNMSVAKLLRGFPTF
jgi:transcriptional regulator with XRE-family HTH domain